MNPIKEPWSEFSGSPRSSHGRLQQSMPRCHAKCDEPWLVNPDRYRCERPAGQVIEQSAPSTPRTGPDSLVSRDVHVPGGEVAGDRALLCRRLLISTSLTKSMFAILSACSVKRPHAIS